ncbi:MAG: DNA-processing protein DprA [Muribaculaceae bacterium]|nr:DNA-processing protein DprA [Muribaculaceae bacterium]
MEFDDRTALFRTAVALTAGLTDTVLRAIRDTGLGYEDFFSLEDDAIKERLGLPPKKRLSLDARQEALAKAPAELEFVRCHKIKMMLSTDEDYPFRLRDATYTPPVLFQLGKTNLDAHHAVAFVGTRTATPYGLKFCDDAIREIGDSIKDTIVVSGLAYGIDVASHIASLRNNIPTVAVVAHGLDSIYPADHRDIARKIIKAGGAIVSEYPHGTSAFRDHFLRRNRIIAGLSDATVVVESDIRGGALSTAAHARSFGRTVAALPGRVADRYSLGCNHLIAKGYASVIESPRTLVEMLGGPAEEAVQPTLIPQLPPTQMLIYNILRKAGQPLMPDQILPYTKLKIPELLSELNEMMLDGILLRHPGNRFEIAI